MEKKRRAISGFDLFLILLALLAVAGWLWITNRPSDVEAVFYGSRATYLIELTDITQEQVDQVQVGDNLLEGARHLPIGQVVAIDVRPTEFWVPNWETQTNELQEVPDRFSMILTVETLVEEAAHEVLTEGGIVIRGGRSINFTGPGYAFAGGMILTLVRGE